MWTAIRSLPGCYAPSGFNIFLTCIAHRTLRFLRPNGWRALVLRMVWALPPKEGRQRWLRHCGAHEESQAKEFRALLAEVTGLTVTLVSSVAHLTHRLIWSCVGCGLWAPGRAVMSTFVAKGVFLQGRSIQLRDPSTFSHVAPLLLIAGWLGGWASSQFPNSCSFLCAGRGSCQDCASPAKRESVLFCAALPNVSS